MKTVGKGLCVCPYDELGVRIKVIYGTQMTLIGQIFTDFIYRCKSA